MKTKLQSSFIALAWLALSTLNLPLSTALAQGTAFTYQGRLQGNGSPASGNYDFTFALFNTNNTNSGQVGGTLTNLNVGVSNGLFIVTLDFGPVFTGNATWLAIGVRSSGAGSFTPLLPLQPLTPAPYSLYAENSGGVTNGSISAAQLNTGGAPASGQVLEFNGSSLQWITPAGGAGGWSLTGNAGTTGSDFLGTTDDEPLTQRVNNATGLVLSPGPANTPNLTVGPFAAAALGGAGINVLSGGYAGGYNIVYPNYSTIAGGFNNTINPGAPESVIAGGQGNVIGGSTSAIGGGYFNTNNGSAGAIPGGANNLVSGSYSFAAGNSAQAVNNGAFVWADSSGGPFASTANNQFSVRALGGVRFVTGGAGLTVDGVSVTGGGGGGGSGWSLTGNAGTTPGVNFLGTTDDEPLELWVDGMQVFTLEPAGGQPNVIGGLGSSESGSTSTTIDGGSYNTAVAASYGTISGGYENAVTNSYSTVGGGQYNAAGANGATVGGGDGNTATGQQSTVAGGTQNLASGNGAVVGGGGYDGSTLTGNTASGGAATVAGGLGNTAFYYATVGGGQNNNAGSYYSAILGGYGNNASGGGAGFIGGGYNNTASGFSSMVPGGVGNLASGGYSFAAGSAAQAVNNGSFVWADDSSGAAFASTANNQFNVRALGGVRFVTGGAGMTIDGVAVGTGGGGGTPNNAWLLTGNAGADPANGYFLGTIDTNGLELHVNGSRGLRLDYTSVESGFFGFSSGINVNGGYWGNTISNGVVGATIAGGGGQFEEDLNFYYYPNSVTGNYGTIGGGYGNVAGNYGTIPGGYDNNATGSGSFALGRLASTSYDGSFVWSDGSEIEYANGADQFDVLATGGVNFHTGGSHGLALTSNGNVGINNSSPSAALDVSGEFMVVEGLTPVRCYLGDDGSGDDVQVGSLQSGITAVSLYNEADNAYMHLYCSSVTVEGGSDLAEPFKVSSPTGELPEGSVVIIDDENPGHLKVSNQPYDTRVAGVLSGANGVNPGIQMQQQGLLEGGKNVALTGRVYVLADAANGSIKPGDLLTTSATPGHAMKVTDHAKAQGAILGKAMSSLQAGQGMVLTLVTLQ
jgi:hypothetical protein